VVCAKHGGKRLVAREWQLQGMLGQSHRARPVLWMKDLKKGMLSRSSRESVMLNTGTKALALPMCIWPQ
jgi:hypothetical protein